MSRGRRQFRVTLDLLCVVANGADAWSDWWGDDADAAWFALRDQLGHAGEDDYRAALGSIDTEPDPRRAWLATQGNA